MSFDPDVVGTASGRFTAPDRRVFPNVQRLDLEGLIGRARSASYVPKRRGVAGNRLLALLRSAVQSLRQRGRHSSTGLRDPKCFCGIVGENLFLRA